MHLTISWAIALRYLRVIKQDIGRLFMIFYWPFFDVVIWGFFGKWIQTTQTDTGYQSLFLMIILLWQLVSRTGAELGITLLEDLWSRNISHLFASPTRVGEWLIGAIIFVGIIMAILTLYCTILAWIFYGISIRYLMWLFALFGPSLFLSGIWIGLIALALIVSLGKSGGEFAFIAAWIFGPVVGTFYPVEMLPSWLQYISYALPMTYVIRSARTFVLNNALSYHDIYISYLLNIVYISAATLFFYHQFIRAKKNGLAKLLQ